MVAPARWAAYLTLRGIHAGKADLPRALASARDRLPDERDRALAGEIAIGVLRWRASLDFLIQHFTKRALDRLDPEVVDALRVALYQLLHLERVPPSAAVSDAVETVRRAGKGSAAGLANAVLRNVLRQRERLPLPPRPATVTESAALDYLSITLSHPRWLAARWLSRYGFPAAETWATFNNAPAPLTLRANPLKTTRDALIDRLLAERVIAHPCRFAPEGVIVEDGNPLGTTFAAEGHFVVQDEASQLVAALARVAPGQMVLDACASPGGKTTAFAGAMQDRGVIVAADVRESRLRLLARTVAQAGASSVRIVRLDAARGLPFGAVFDWVVVDAPCSGLGTIRRDPDIRWRRREEDLPALAQTQRSMIHHAADAVRSGGALVYATCSSEPEENEEIVERFLDARPAFRVEDPRELRATPTGISAVVTAAGHLRTTPPEHGLEAFFGAVLRRSTS